MKTIRRWVNRLGFGICCAALSGCATFDRSAVDMAMHYNVTMDEIDRKAALLNVLRAAHDMPMTFSTLSFVSGSGSLSGNASGSGALSSTNLGLSASRSMSFSLNSLDNEQFMRGFMAEISPDRLHYLLHGIKLKPQVIWTALVESVSFHAQPARMPQVIANEPEATTWSEFQTVLSDGLRLGLTMEMRQTQAPVGPPLSRDEALSQTSTIVSYWNQSGSLGTPMARPRIVASAQATPDKPFQLVMQGEAPVFCFSPRDFSAWPYAEGRLCHNTGARAAFLQWRETQSQRGSAPRPEQSDRWSALALRSPREVFQFLGAVVGSQLQQPGRLWRVGVQDRAAEEGYEPLIKVICDAQPQGTPPLVVVEFQGRTCLIPGGDNGHSAQVLQLLSVLTTLSKVSGSLPATPTLLVR